MEKRILDFWKSQNIFKKTLEAREGAEPFVFFEGPPTANGRPGIHHVLARSFKDLICRYKTMQGFHVARKAGWDTHGLPVELQVEKELGFTNKQEIEEYGIDKFNQKCRESVWQYKSEWEGLTERIGFWLDMEKPYITYEKEYIETLWHILKQVWERDLLYEGYKVVPFCPRCGTALSSHELAQGYKKVAEESVYVKMKIKGEEDVYFLVWTTTPWTLPANVALAVNESLAYVKVKTDQGVLILAEERIKALKGEHEILERKKGKDLLGLEYEPLYNFIPLKERAHFVVGGDFVSAEDGTGIVHIAPAFGEDDMNVGKENKLPVLMTVNERGEFLPEIELWAGRPVKKTDPDIIIDLKERGILYKTETYSHDYPFCWRCDTALIYYAKKSWFIKMSDLRDKLIAGNKEINWVPEYIKEGRFGEWLREIKDWAISRERYWGTPLPIWRCAKCGEIKVIGSIKELEEASGEKIDDLHRPFVDKISFKCEKCSGKMGRVNEVADVWFDSGAMPFAQYHWPFDGEKIPFPADYICEAVDQTRGWFYTLLAVAVLLGKKAPYKNVICLGHVLDEKGQKMSKSKGNVIDPWMIIDKYGADAARWFFYTVNQPGQPKRMAEKDVQDKQRRFIMTLMNVLNFYETYKNKAVDDGSAEHILDKWIISRLHQTNKNVENFLDAYDVVSAARELDIFTDDLSNWYLRRSRKRSGVCEVLGAVLKDLSKLLAPFTPFIAEEIYLKLKEKKKDKESVHLCDWPKADDKKINKEALEKMSLAREITAAALKIRKDKNIKVRQPLNCLFVQKAKAGNLGEDILELIRDEVNIKEVKLHEEMNNFVELDLEITPELKEEGNMRDFIRFIQTLRKDGGLTPEDKIRVFFSTHKEESSLASSVEKWMTQIKEQTLAEEIIRCPEKTKEAFLAEQEIKMDNEDLWLAINKS